jgi:hypothetical protein
MAKQNTTNKLHSLKHRYLKQFFGRNLFLVQKKSIFGGCGEGGVGGTGQERNLFDMKAQNLHYEVVDLQGGHVRNSIMNL